MGKKHASQYANFGWLRYVAQVYIWEDNSKPWSLRLGNSSIMDLK